MTMWRGVVGFAVLGKNKSLSTENVGELKKSLSKKDFPLVENNVTLAPFSCPMV
ncbi:MAG: hypothetical protein V1746_02700 [bacterium]